MNSDDTGESLLPTARFRAWVAAHPVGGPALIGLIATQIATIIGYFLRGIGLPQVPWPLYNGVLFAPGEYGEAGEGFGKAPSFFVGQSIHMVDGVIFAILFAIAFQGKLGRIPAIAKGVIYSMILAIISMGFLVPYVYVPHQGFGLFSFYGQDTWKLPVSIALFHLAYGFMLGFLYQPDYRGEASDNRSV
jgi:hypothetical protein